jgi:hypothetical protein
MHSTAREEDHPAKISRCWTPRREAFQEGISRSQAGAAERMLDDILAEGSDVRRAAYDFFRLFRDCGAGGYYSTPEGGYVGNVPIPHFPGPSPEALAHLFDS